MTLPPNSCRRCGATSYRRVVDRDASGRMQATDRNQCTGCKLVFTHPAEWRRGPERRPMSSAPPESFCGGQPS